MGHPIICDMRFTPRDDLAGCSPLEVLSRWPLEVPVAMLHSHPAAASGGRWSILARPHGIAEVEAETGEWTGECHPAAEVARRGAVAMLEYLDQEMAAQPESSVLPPFGGWIGCLHYELGAVFEPTVGQVPQGIIGCFQWCPDALLHDSRTDLWLACGQPPTLKSGHTCPAPLKMCGPLTSTPHADDWPEVVATAVESIRKGDIFQVNLCRRISLPIKGDPRSFAITALSEPQTAFGALLEIQGANPRTIVSMSPELFFEVNQEGRILTRPIKGTLPAAQPPEVLHASAKDAAELHMIVDLMRNDLGRVCEIGSVHVPCPRRIESHPTVHHGVGEVCGNLKSGVHCTDILRALFPAGSITGAPKIKAMQIASSLEPFARGAYCGAITLFGPGRSMVASVAIRTAVFENNSLVYGVGCGIVADSDPLAELAESETKAEVLRKALDTVNLPVATSFDVAEVLQSHA